MYLLPRWFADKVSVWARFLMQRLIILLFDGCWWKSVYGLPQSVLAECLHHGQCYLSGSIRSPAICPDITAGCLLFFPSFCTKGPEICFLYDGRDPNPNPSIFLYPLFNGGDFLLEGEHHLFVIARLEWTLNNNSLSHFLF